MLRMWLKFTEKDGKRVIDRASFQAFGCQTAIAVASMATELLRGKTADEAKHLTASELTGDLGALPPMKIHCGQLVEGALRNALDNSGSAGRARRRRWLPRWPPTCTASRPARSASCRSNERTRRLFPQPAIETPDSRRLLSLATTLSRVRTQGSQFHHPQRRRGSPAGRPRLDPRAERPLHGHRRTVGLRQDDPAENHRRPQSGVRRRAVLG